MRTSSRSSCPAGFGACGEKRTSETRCWANQPGHSAIDDCANLVRQWRGARQRLLQVSGLVGVQPLLGEVGVAREPLELCDERVGSAALREGDGEKDAAVPPPTLLDLVNDGGGVDQRQRLGRFGHLVEQVDERPGGLLVPGTAEGERGDPSLLGLAVLGDVNQALTHGEARDAGREPDHLRMLGRRVIPERPHDVLAHLEPAVSLEWQARKRIEDGEPCRRRVVTEGINQRPRLRASDAARSRVATQTTLLPPSPHFTAVPET